MDAGQKADGARPRQGPAEPFRLAHRSSRLRRVCIRLFCRVYLITAAGRERYEEDAEPAGDYRCANQV